MQMKFNLASLLELTAISRVNFSNLKEVESFYIDLAKVANSPSMIHATSPQPRSGGHLRCHAASYVTKPREASPDESEGDTWTSHGSMGPPERLNRLMSTCTLGTDLGAHKIATPRKHNPRG
jgi:hypothetical protein